MNSVDKQIDIAWKLFQNNQEMIKFADSKIMFLLVISGVFTTHTLTNLRDLFSAGILCQIVVVLFFIAFLVFTIYALLTIYPRHRSKTEHLTANLIYFKNIYTRKDVGQYIEDFQDASDEQILEDILFQNFQVAAIATKKFKYYDRSWIFLGIQAVAFIVLLILGGNG